MRASTMRAAIYIRVSTDEQADDGYSLAAQERAGRAYAQSQGWEIAKIYADEGLSGRRENRPALLQLRADVAAGAINAVIVHKLDRLARNLRLMIEIIEEFGKQKAAFVSVTEQIDFSTPLGWAMFQVQGVFAELYSRNLSAETSKGKREKAQQGGWVGPLPIGYAKDPKGDLFPSEDAECVRLMFELYATRQHSYTSLADELNARGYRSSDWQTGRRGRFGRETVRTILMNRAYIGEVSAGGTRYKGRHQPLVSQELFSQVEEIRNERTYQHGSPVRACRGWLISLLYCTGCGGKYWHTYGSNDNRGRYYICGGVSRRECTIPRVRAEIFEGQMLEILQRLIIPEQLIPRVIAEAQRLAKQAALVAVEDTGAIDQRMRQLKEAYNADILTKAEYEKKLRALQEQHAPGRAVPLNTRRALEQLQRLPQLLEQSEPYERLALVKSLFTQVWVRDRKIVRLTPRSDVGDTLAGIAMVVDGVPDGPCYPYPHIQNSALECPSTLATAFLVKSMQGSLRCFQGLLHSRFQQA